MLTLECFLPKFGYKKDENASVYLLFFDDRVFHLYISPGWRDHKDHESLHKHDREEALQCEVCVQLWKQLDQVIDSTEGTKRTQPQCT